MVYYFTVSPKKGEYIPLDITKSKYFEKNSRYIGMGRTLAEIDAFTMMFNDEADLRKNLHEENILAYKYLDKPLSTRLSNKGVYKKVPYDFLYQKDIEYVIDPNNVVERINQKLLNKDYRFIEEYAKTFMKCRDCSSTAPEVLEYVRNSIIFERTSPHFYDLDENEDNTLVRMTKLLIYEYYQAPNGKVFYKDKIKYRNLHMIIAFTNYYENKHMEDYHKVEEKNITTGKVKTLKKQENIPGQMNLFE